MVSRRMFLRSQREVDELFIKNPTVHIVKPADVRDKPGLREDFRTLPVELHIFRDQPNFERRFPLELYRMVKELYRDGAEYITLRFDKSEDTDGFIRGTASQMGFQASKEEYRLDKLRFKSFAEKHMNETL